MATPLQDKLARLLRLATLKEGEDSARENEARNAAMLLLKECAKNGVTIVFRIPEPARAPPPPRPAPAPMPDAFADLMRRYQEELYRSGVNFGFGDVPPYVYRDERPPPRQEYEPFRSGYDASPARARPGAPTRVYLGPDNSIFHETWFLEECPVCRAGFAPNTWVWRMKVGPDEYAGPISHEECGKDAVMYYPS